MYAKLTVSRTFTTPGGHVIRLSAGDCLLIDCRFGPHVLVKIPGGEPCGVLEGEFTVVPFIG